MCVRLSVIQKTKFSFSYWLEFPNLIVVSLRISFDVWVCKSLKPLRTTSIVCFPFLSSLVSSNRRIQLLFLKNENFSRKFAPRFETFSKSKRNSTILFFYLIQSTVNENIAFDNDVLATNCVEKSIETKWNIFSNKKKWEIYQHWSKSPGNDSLLFVATSRLIFDSNRQIKKRNHTHSLRYSHGPVSKLMKHLIAIRDRQIFELWLKNT